MTDYSKVQAWVGNLRRNNPIFTPKIEAGSYLNVGCGPNIREDFVNIDYLWRPGVDLCCDITKPIPIGDGQVGGVYTEHCLEHIPLDGTRLFLSECLRMLMPGGTIRIVVPDLEMYARAYVRTLDGQPAVLPNDYFVNATGVNKPVALINEVFYGPSHRFMYDFRTLAEVLEQAGFTKAVKLSLNEGSDPRLLIDVPERVSESLYVEARKP
ncbi:MAG: methyltransferase domain-containing protein [Proteobacteria bacterium]|nr:methyltransferase domain-containing protein [Pseudomonadota bacterium]